MRSLTWSNGGKYVGEWKDNKQWNGIIYDPNGNIIGIYVNGEYIEQYPPQTNPIISCKKPPLIIKRWLEVKLNYRHTDFQSFGG